MARLLGCLVVLLAVGCEDPELQNDEPGGGVADGGSGGSAAMADGGDATVSGDAGAGMASAPEEACNDLELDAPPYSLSYDENAAPEAMGGEIPDGTYFLTAQVMYEMASGIELELGRTKVTIADGVWQEISGDAEVGSVNPDKATTSTLDISGTYLKLTRACPQIDLAEEAEFTADESGFTIYVVDAGTTFGTVFTRQ